MILSFEFNWWAFSGSNRGSSGYEPEAVTDSAKGPNQVFALLELERHTGIEPAFSAWEADVLPLHQ